MIKPFKYLLTLSCFALLLVNCKSDNEDQVIPDEEETTLSAAPTALSFEAAGGTETLEITSNTAWKISYTSSWCRPSIQTTQGNASVTITADANDVAEERTATFIITAEGAEDIAITITQKAKPKEPGEEAYIEPDNTGMRELTALELSQLMTVGWNLGNSLEAINVSGETYSGNETSWGNPAVTKTLIDAVKAAGFNAVRIPVSWSHKMDAEYNIDPEWKQRVEEVVNYVLDNDMYAIINIHWDGGWMNHPDNAHKEAINTKLEKMWKQIAIHFRDYNDYLLFAGTNEVHVENNYDAPSAENAEVQNSFNQTFIDAVRATGGRNTYRHLIVQGYNTNIEHAKNFLTIPDDPTDNRLMVEVHFYDPYDFTLMEDGDFKTQWGQDFAGGDVSTWGQEDWVDDAFGMMKTEFVDKGYPVILGEYGALLRSSLSSGLEEHIQARNYYLEYVTKAALENGMVPFYWDNGYTGNNSFGLFNRSTGAIVHQDAVDAIMRGAQDD